MTNSQKIFWIDLFSGAGGTTSGIHLANNPNMKVVACVNHDPIAIESHKANHPDCKHFVEDVRNFEVVLKLKTIVIDLRKRYPGCKINIWASLECTNFSNAKGGQPRDADSRTLANSMFIYLEELNPDYFYIENVKEFMSWGPLDKNGKPVSKDKGIDYLKWIKTVCSYGFEYDYKLLNAADFGAYTSRIRYFGIFAKFGHHISWPIPTHAKKPTADSNLKKWKAVKSVLDLEDEGKSIFNRPKPLVENTLERIYCGLIKFVAGGKDQWILKYNSKNKNQQHKPPSIEEPCPVVTTQNRLGIVKCNFISKYFSGKPEHKNIPITGPAATIKTKDSQALVSCNFLTSYYGNGGAHSVDEPCLTLSTKDRFSKVFIDKQYGNGTSNSVDEPASTLTANPKLNIVQAQNFLLNPSWGSNTHSIENPSPVIIARQDKAPMYLIQSIEGNYTIPIYEDDSPFTKKIKELMALYGLCDVKMRMLKVSELLLIQGFPKNYILKGSQLHQKKFIGNSVETTIAKKLVQANYNININTSVA